MNVDQMKVSIEMTNAEAKKLLNELENLRYSTKDMPNHFPRLEEMRAQLQNWSKW